MKRTRVKSIRTHLAHDHHHCTMAAVTVSLPPQPQTTLPIGRKTRPVARVSLASLTPNNLGTLRKLNSVLFPIRYSEKFYKQVLEPELEEFCKLSEWRRLIWRKRGVDVSLTLFSLLQ